MPRNTISVISILFVSALMRSFRLLSLGLLVFAMKKGQSFLLPVGLSVALAWIVGLRCRCRHTSRVVQSARVRRGRLRFHPCPSHPRSSDRGARRYGASGRDRAALARSA